MLELFVGPIAGTLGIYGLGFQLFKMIQTKQTKAISYNMSIFLGVSLAMWAAYGITQNDPMIYLTNFAMLGVLIVIFLYKSHMEKTITSFLSSESPK